MYAEEKNTVMSTLLEMLLERGYDDVEDLRLSDGDPGEFESIYSLRGEVMLLFAYPRLTIDQARAAVLMGSDPSVQLLIVLNMGKEKTTHQAKATLEEGSASAEIEVFFGHELYINPLRHCLVPKTTRVRDISKINVDILPRLSDRDPIARFKGLKPGEVVSEEHIFGEQPRITIKRLVVSHKLLPFRKQKCKKDIFK